MKLFGDQRARCYINGHQNSLLWSTKLHCSTGRVPHSYEKHVSQRALDCQRRVHCGTACPPTVGRPPQGLGQPGRLREVRRVSGVGGRRVI